MEDDLSLRRLYEKALSLTGYDVIGLAKDGSFSEKPDVIIMDHRMPVKNGFDASEEILENSSEYKPKIIFASADQTIKEQALSIGIESFKEKPFTLKRLFNNIEKVVNTINV